MSYATARRIWKCGWDKEKKDINYEQGCGNEIYKDDKDGLVKNLKDNVGGLRDKRHICPNRVGSKWHHFDKINMIEHEYHLRHKLCGECLGHFDSIRNPLCPNCFKLECPKCGNQQQWLNNERITVKKTSISDTLNSWRFVLDTSKPEIDNNKCNSCGHQGMFVHQIWNAYQRIYGKYEW